MSNSLRSLQTTFELLPRRIWSGVLFYQNFVRLPAFGFSALLPLLGAATVSPELSSKQILGCVGMALIFHHFGYVLNDLIDLPLDRTQPAKAMFPLVQGNVQPWQAWLFVLIQIPMAAMLNQWLTEHSSPLVPLSIGFGMTGVYNVWGKRTIFPPLTDLAQGLAWAGLYLFGVLVSGGSPTPLTWWMAVFVVLFTMQVNGVPASLRDLQNDADQQQSTTALLLGVRPNSDGSINIPFVFKGYALVLQTLITASILWPLCRNDFAYHRLAWLMTFLSVTALSGIAAYLLTILLRSNNSRRTFISALTLYIFLSLSMPVFLFGIYLGSQLLISIVLVCVAPLLISGWWYDSWRWGMRLFRRKV